MQTDRLGGDGADPEGGALQAALAPSAHRQSEPASNGEELQSMMASEMVLSPKLPAALNVPGPRSVHTPPPHVGQCSYTRTLHAPCTEMYEMRSLLGQGLLVS